MRAPAKRLMAGLFLALGLNSQTLRVTPSHTGSKTPGSFTVAIESTHGEMPAAVQWEISVPPALDIRIADLGIGKAAASAGKTLTCALSPRKVDVPGGARYACILAGGHDLIGNGPLLEVHYRARASAGGAPIRVTFDNIQGVSTDLKMMAIPNVDAIIHIPIL